MITVVVKLESRHRELFETLKPQLLQLPHLFRPVSVPWLLPQGFRQGPHL